MDTPLALAASNVGLQGTMPGLPERTESREPLIGLTKRFGIDGVQPPLAVSANEGKAV